MARRKKQEPKEGKMYAFIEIRVLAVTVGCRVDEIGTALFSSGRLEAVKDDGEGRVLCFMGLPVRGFTTDRYCRFVIPVGRRRLKKIS